MKTVEEITTARSIARAIWSSRQDINDAIIPLLLSPEEKLAWQIRLAAKDQDFLKAFLMDEVLCWLLGDEEEENLVTELLDQFTPVGDDQ